MQSAWSVVVQADGKIVASGGTGIPTLGGYVDIALARYNTDGTLDDTFDGDGKVTTAVDTKNWTGNLDRMLGALPPAPRDFGGMTQAFDMIQEEMPWRP